MPSWQIGLMVYAIGLVLQLFVLGSWHYFEREWMRQNMLRFGEGNWKEYSAYLPNKRDVLVRSLLWPLLLAATLCSLEARFKLRRVRNNWHTLFTHPFGRGLKLPGIP